MWRPLSSETAAAMAESVSLALDRLGEMYGSVGELLRLPETRRELAGGRWLTQELDASVTLLDVCAAAREAISSVKQQAQDLCSALRTRRGGGAAALGGAIRAYFRTRKAAREEGARCLRILKQMERKRAARPAASTAARPAASTAAEGLTEAAIAVFRTLSSVMLQGAAPASVKRKWLPGKMKKSAAEDDVPLRGLGGRPRPEDDDAAVLEVAEEAQRQLHRLEAGLRGLEAGLENAFRRLVQHRVLLLNILSQ